MLIKILPEQVSNNWELISFAIEQSFPPFVKVDAARMSLVLEAILEGSLDCWVSVNKQKEIEAVATTQVLADFVTGTKTLLIYSTYGFQKIEDKSWREAFNTICQYARNLGCQKLSCYTTVDTIIDQAKKFNGEIQHYIAFNL